jgi:hypothetical protein
MFPFRGVIRGRMAPLALFVLTIAVAVGAPVQRDLGNGLIYYRLHALPADLPPKPPLGGAGPCVVDVRYVRTNADAAAAFLAWLEFRASSRAPVFVLANAQTSTELTKPLTEESRTAGVVVVGIPGRHFAPHVPVSSSAENERRAYDALDHGVALGTLITDNPNKVRNDEASLSKDRVAEASADAADDAIVGKLPSQPLIDSTLQRAVHLHRALVALKKL